MALASFASLPVDRHGVSDFWPGGFDFFGVTGDIFAKCYDCDVDCSFSNFSVLLCREEVVCDSADGISLVVVVDGFNDASDVCAVSCCDSVAGVDDCKGAGA